MESLTAAIERRPYDEQLLDTHITDLRRVFAKALGSTDIERDIAPISGEVSTSLRAHPIRLWAQAAGDPGIVVVPWLLHGAPSGIDDSTSDLDKLWPRKDHDGREIDGAQLLHDYIDAEPITKAASK